MNDQKKVYDYLEYRSFLKERYEELKKSNKKYSQRYFMQKLGAKSTGFFAEILNGKRNLNHENVVNCVKAFKLDSEESEYFGNLVLFNQSRSVEEKKHWLQKMMECSKVNSTILNRDVYSYFSKWYYTAIRELLFFYRQQVQPEDISRMLCPQITPEEAVEALALLERLGLIEKSADGSYAQKDTLVATGDQIWSVEIANYQMQTIELAKQALDTVPAAQRDISTLTMSISADAYATIIEILKKTQQDIIKVTQRDHNEDRVYQLNMQFYPLTAI